MGEEFLLEARATYYSSPNEFAIHQINIKPTYNTSQATTDVKLGSCTLALVFVETNKGVLHE